MFNTILNLEVGALLSQLAFLLLTLKKRKMTTLGHSCYLLSSCFLGITIALLWIHLGRPPLRTLGETRLWYGFLLPLVGLFMYHRLREMWILIYTALIGSLFIFINCLHPENFDKTLPPALQSAWFIPHVIVYMVAYAFLGASSLYALLVLLKRQSQDSNPLVRINSFVYWGFAYLTMGLIFGAAWAKGAWGHYWSWDPKESWAFLTWIIYLNYIHLSRIHLHQQRLALGFLVVGFVILLGCWFGVNYMPSAASSVHTYTR